MKTCKECGTRFDVNERDVEFYRVKGVEFEYTMFGNDLCLDCAIDAYDEFCIRDALMQIKYGHADPEDFPNVDLEGYYLDESDELQEG